MGVVQIFDQSALSVVQALLESLRAHDEYTYGHCMRVGKSAKLLAEAAQLNPFEQRVVEFSGFLHDIGKIGIPEKILRKHSRLTESEEKIMQTHAVMSERIVAPLSHIPFFRALLPGIRHHHERIDGQGYPNGLLAEQIPLAARIVAVADAVDAITTRRPYRNEETWRKACNELTKYAGTQFDARLAMLYVETQSALDLGRIFELPLRLA